MGGPRGRGLNDKEIEFALSESEYGSEDDGGTDLCDIDINFVPNGFRDDSSSSDDDVPRSELVSRPTRGRPRSRRATPRGRRRGASRRGRSRSRSVVTLVQEERQEFEIEEPAREWLETDFVASEIPFTQPAYLEYPSSQFSDYYDYFKQYIDDDLIELIVSKSNRTQVQKTGTSLNLSNSELYVYLGINMIMSTINYPMLRMYWEKEFRIAVIADNMSRNRFFLLRNAIKFVYDDDIRRDVRDVDRLWKIRPLLDKILKGCGIQIKEECLSIDEMIVPFTGQCGLKQYVPNKPNPTGLKIFVLANSNGIVCDFNIYQGNTTYPNYENTNFGLGEKAVLNLTEELAPGHKLYFDRYFTTQRLVKELKQRNLVCTGNVMKNRIPISARQFVKEDRELKLEGRGTCQVLVNHSENAALTKWLDNKSVALLSTAHAKYPEDSCKRWSKANKQYVQIPRPIVVKAYNDNMGGVDLADRMLSVCPNRYRTRKWTQRLFSHTVDLACSNSWLQFKKNQLADKVPLKRIVQLRMFKLELGKYLLDANAGTSEVSSEDEGAPKALKRGQGKPPMVHTPSVKLRKSGAHHLPEITDVQTKCRHCHKMKTTVKCTHCNVHLCFTKNRNCFRDLEMIKIT